MPSTQSYDIACHTTCEDRKTWKSDGFLELKEKKLLNQEDDDTTTSYTSHSCESHDYDQDECADKVHQAYVGEQSFMFASAIQDSFVTTLPQKRREYLL